MFGQDSFSLPLISQVEADKEVGKMTERRFFQAMQSDPLSTPHWFMGVRRGTEYEDHSGIDAIATLDIGMVRIQIKSSWNWVDKFYKDGGRENILVIVIRTHETATRIRGKTFRLLAWKRRLMERSIVKNKRTRVCSKRRK